MLVIRLFSTRGVFTALFVLLASAFTAFGQEDSTQAGVDDYRAGNYQSSIEKLSKAVRANEKNRAAWLYLGGSHLKGAI